MRKLLVVVSFVLPGVVALFAAPASAIYATRGPDPADLYLLVSLDVAAAEATAISLGARSVGPIRATLSVFVAADPAARAALEAQGYLLLAGSTLSDICGFALKKETQ